MKTKLILVLLLSAALGACALHPAHTWTNYTLSQAAPGPRSDKAVPLSLQVAAVEAPSWLNSRDMYYRLAYSDANSISSYSRSRWLAPPPTMLVSLLVDRLSHAGLWRAVVGPGSGVFADYTLKLHLTRFEQVFTSPGHSDGIVAARVSLVDGHSDAVIAQRGFRFKVVAPTADAQGGAAALGRASDELAVAVEHWLVQIQPVDGRAPAASQGAG